VLGISRVEQRSGGGLTVRGAASSGRYAGYSVGGQTPVDLTFKCSTDYRGYVSRVDIRPAQSNYGSYSPYQGYGQSNGYGAYGNVQYGNSQYGTDYSQYGYSRY